MTKPDRSRLLAYPALSRGDSGRRPNRAVLHEAVVGVEMPDRAVARGLDDLRRSGCPSAPLRASPMKADELCSTLQADHPAAHGEGDDLAALTTAAATRP